MTTRSLQEYRYAATQAGLTTEQMDGALTRLTRTIGEAAQGGRAQVAVFERLGVSIRDAGGNIREAGDLLPDIAEGLRRLGSEAERSTAYNDLFGRSGQQMATLLGEGAEGVNNLRDAAHRLGLVINDDLINRADAAADEMAALGTVLQIEIASTVAENAQAIRDLTQALVGFVGWAGEAATAWRRFGQAWNDLPADAVLSMPGLFPDAVVSGARDYRRNAERERYGPRVEINPPPSLFSGMGHQINAALQVARNAGRRANTGSIVEAIAPAGGRGRSGGGGSGRASNDNGIARELQRLMDDAFPIRAAQRELTEGVDALDAALRRGTISAADHAHAVATLRSEFGAAGEGNVIAQLAQDARREIAEFQIEVPDTQTVLRAFNDDLEEQMRRMQEAAQAQQAALQDMLSNIQTFADGIRSGDVLGIISGLLGALDQIGNMTGGFNIAGLQFGMPKYASGTSYHPGGLAMVGERGRELVNLPRGSQVIPNHALGGMGSASVQVIPSPYFDVVVNGHVQRGISGAAPAIAEGGAALAQGRLGFRQSRRVA